MPTIFKMDKGWQRYFKALDPKKFKGAMRKELRRAAKLNGALVEREIRDVIKSGAFDDNADLTISIKGSTKPLVDRSQLFKSITSLVVSDVISFTGVLRTDGAFNIAQLLHDGGTIGVTPKMRGLFSVLWKASKGSLDPSKLTGAAEQLFSRKQEGWFPLKATTDAIVVPARPFILKAFASSRLASLVKANWNDAVARALRERAKR